MVPAEALAAALAATGTTVAFGVPGGGPNLDVVGAMHAAGIEFVLAHSETAACIMATTWGGLTNNVSAAIVTRGPGAASAVNGAAQATLDRQPLVLVTDTVPAESRTRVPHQRLDQQAMLQPVSKASLVLGGDATPAALEAVIGHAKAWPAGAIHLDYDTSSLSDLALPGRPPRATDATAEARTAELIAAASHPIVLVGCEALSDASQIRGAIESFGAPVLSTYQAIGIVPTEHDLFAGLFTNGASEQPLLAEADLVIAIGLDTVEPIPAEWLVDVPVISLASTPSSDDYFPLEVEIVDAVGPASQRLLVGHHEWTATAGAEHNRWVRSQLTAEPHGGGFGPTQLVAAVVDATSPAATITVDAGAHFLAIMPLWPVARPRQLLISNGLATMGYAVPAAIGAAIARPGTPIVALTGDGGLGMCLAELETIVRLELPITVVVFNDAALSLIEIKQQPHHGGDAAVRYRPTDFAAAANAMGMNSVVAASADEVTAALQHGVSAPLLIDARIDPRAYAHLIRVTRG